MIIVIVVGWWLNWQRIEFSITDFYPKLFLNLHFPYLTLNRNVQQPCQFDGISGL